MQSLFVPPNRVVRRGVLAGEPSRHRRLALRVELDGLAARDVGVAEKRLVPAGEGEPRHRRGHADVDADHPGVEALLELAGGVAAAREDARAVAEIASLADRDRLL